MALPTRNIQLNEIANIDTFYNGGKGSGNFGHAGRPGERGGSGSGKGSSSSEKKTPYPKYKDEEEYYTEIKGASHTGDGLWFVGRKKEGMEKIGYVWGEGGMYRKDKSKPSSSVVSKKEAFEYSVGEDIEKHWRYGGIQQSKKSRYKRIKEILDSPDDSKFEMSDSGKGGFHFKFKRIEDKK